MGMGAARGWVAACLLLATGAVPAGERVPSLQATTLAGEAFRVPADLASSHALLVVGFSKDSRRQTSAWIQCVAGDAQLSRQLPVYQVVALESVPAMFRGTVVASIRRSVPQAQHGRFLVLTRDESAWKALARYRHADDAYALLLQDGAVAWRASGACSAGRLAELKAATSRVLQQAVP